MYLLLLFLLNFAEIYTVTNIFILDTIFVSYKFYYVSSSAKM